MSDDTGPVEVPGSAEGQHVISAITHEDASLEDDTFTLDLQRWLVNAFIVFHLGAIIFWNLPPAALQISVAKIYQPYMFMTGSWQQWTMFSPDPVNLNTYLEATIHYKNGSSRDYTFPRISKLGPLSKYREERWRKFIESTEDTGKFAYWPYLARYADIQCNYAPKTNPVESIDLYRRQQAIVYGGEYKPEYLKEKMMTFHAIALPSQLPGMSSD